MSTLSIIVFLSYELFFLVCGILTIVSTKRSSALLSLWRVFEKSLRVPMQKMANENITLSACKMSHENYTNYKISVFVAFFIGIGSLIYALLGLYYVYIGGVAAETMNTVSTVSVMIAIFGYMVSESVKTMTQCDVRSLHYNFNTMATHNNKKPQ